LLENLSGFAGSIAENLKTKTIAFLQREVIKIALDHIVTYLAAPQLGILKLLYKGVTFLIENKDEIIGLVRSVIETINTIFSEAIRAPSRGFCTLEPRRTFVLLALRTRTANLRSLGCSELLVPLRTHLRRYDLVMQMLRHKCGISFWLGMPQIKQNIGQVT